MKNALKLFLTASLLAACALLFSACAAPTIREASSTLKISNPMTGKAVEVSLPKNLDAETLLVKFNPKTSAFELSAAKIKADASTVIDSAARAQAEAVAELSRTLGAVVPFALPAAKLPAAPPGETK